MQNYNELSPGETERLAWLMEELAEVQQAIGKILRHGYNSKDPSNPNHLGNRADLERELADVFHALLLMNEKGDIDLNSIYHHGMDLITSNSKQYMHHQNGE